MAIKLADAVVFFAGDRSQLDRDLGAAEKDTKGWAGRLGGTAKALIGGAIVGAAATATAAVVGIGVAAFSTASQMRQGTNDIQASLGVTKEEAESLGQVAIEVFKNNFAGSIEEANAAIIEARQQLGKLTDAELQDATENALRLSDVFGVDIGESLNAANTLMKDFGLTQQQAFDFLASGFQQGLDSSGDFIDTITEYSTQFSNAGADADQFFSLMQSGLQGGMLGTDRAADAFKEFRVRIQDGSKTTGEALAALGIDSANLAARMADGSVTATDAFQMVIERLRLVDDENVRMQAGVGLLGTQFEDLGTEAALALDLTGTKMADLAGATDSLDAKYNNLGAVVEGFKRRALVAFAPIGNKLLDMANEALPYVMDTIDQLAAVLEQSLDKAVEFITSVVLPGIRQFVDLLITLARYFGFVVEEGDYFNDWLADVPVFLRPIVETFGRLVTLVIEDVIPAFRNFVKTIITAPGEGGVLLDYLQEVPEFLQPIAKILAELAIFIVNTAIPTLRDFGAWFLAEGLPILRTFANTVITQLVRYLNLAIDFINTTVLPILSEFGEWFLNIGAPAILDFAKVAIPQIIKGLRQLSIWITDIAAFLLPLLAEAARFIAENIFPLLADAVTFVIDNFNIIGPILGVVAGLILALTSPITLVIGALVLLATAWANNWGGIQEKTQAVLDFIVPKVQWAMDFISGIVTPILSYLRDWWQQHGDSVITIVEWLWNTVSSLFKVTLDAIITNVETALDLITTIIKVFIAAVQAFWEKWGDEILTITKLMWDSIKVVIKTVLDIIGYIIDAFAAVVKGDWQAFGDAILGIWRTAWDGISTILSNAAEGLLTVLNQLKDDAIAIWTGVKDKFKGIGNDIVEGLKKGIEEKWEAFKSWLDEKVGGLIERIKQGFGIFSPSQVFMDIGREIQAGLALGIEQGEQMPVRAMQTSVRNVTNNFYQNIRTSHVGNAGGQFQQMKAMIST